MFGPGHANTWKSIFSPFTLSGQEKSFGNQGTKLISMGDGNETD